MGCFKKCASHCLGRLQCLGVITVPALGVTAPATRRGCRCRAMANHLRACHRTGHPCHWPCPTGRVIVAALGRHAPLPGLSLATVARLAVADHAAGPALQAAPCCFPSTPCTHTLAHSHVDPHRHTARWPLCLPALTRRCRVATAWPRLALPYIALPRVGVPPALPSLRRQCCVVASLGQRRPLRRGAMPPLACGLW